MDYIVSLYRQGPTWHAQVYARFSLHGRMLCDVPAWTKTWAKRKAVNIINHLDDCPKITVRERA